MEYKIIANPIAGRDKAMVVVQRVKKMLDERKVKYDLQFTRSPGDATEIAHLSAKEGWDVVISIGGDGTASEIIGGLAGSNTTIGIISCGTGNDFARNLSLPTDINQAMETILSGKRRKIDVGWERDQIFVNIGSVGFVSEVTAQANAFSHLKGSLSFFIATYKALSKLKAKHVRIELDNEVIETEAVSVTVSNMKYAGGGMVFAPDTVVDDGLFDVCIIGKIGKVSLALTFPQMYKDTGPKHPALNRYRSRTVKITCDHPLDKMFDGNINGTTPLEAKILPSAVEVIIP